MDIQRLRARAAELIAKQRTHGLTEREVDECHEITRQMSEYNAARKSQKPLDELSKLVGPHTVPVDGLSGGSPFADAVKNIYPYAKARTAYGVEVETKDSTNFDEHIVSPVLRGGDYIGAAFTVMSLFGQDTASGPTQRVYRVLNEAAADIVPEGGLKPDAGLTMEPYDVDLVTIALTHKLSNQFLEDQATFANQIPRELMKAIVLRENQYAVTTILGTSGLLTGTSTSVLDGVADAVATLQTAADLTPNGVVLNPLDLAAVRKVREGTDGAYIAAPLSPAGNTIHGVPFVVTPGIAQGTVLVGEFKSAGTAYRRGGINVDTATTGDDFERNKVTLRTEERVALGMERPGHVVNLTITVAP